MPPRKPMVKKPPQKSSDEDLCSSSAATTPRPQKSPQPTSLFQSFSPLSIHNLCEQLYGSKKLFQSPPSQDTIRILITSDNHLGYAEEDVIRGEDSFRTFEEALWIGKETHCDLFLFGGDLFHDNKPSRNTLLRTTQLLRHYCCGERRPTIRIISDEQQHFSDGKSNFDSAPHFADFQHNHNPTNISIPAFTIHGNHDDPTGNPAISALDILHEAKLLNYFGKHDNIDRLKISPIVIQKTTSLLALYGIGNLRDERMANIFKHKLIDFQRFSLLDYIYNNEKLIQEHNREMEDCDHSSNLDRSKILCNYLEFKEHALRYFTKTTDASTASDDSSIDLFDSDDDTLTKRNTQFSLKLDKSATSTPHPFSPQNISLHNHVTMKKQVILTREVNISHFIDDVDDGIFHLPIIHQNRCSSCLAGNVKDAFTENGRTANTIHPLALPPFSDLVLWGHEHCSFPKVLEVQATPSREKLKKKLRKDSLQKKKAAQAYTKAKTKVQTELKKEYCENAGNSPQIPNFEPYEHELGTESDEDLEASLSEPENDSLQSTIRVLQPGSTVITSLCPGEAFPKHAFILEVRGENYRLTPMRLHTARQFIIEDFHIEPGILKGLYHELKRRQDELNEKLRIEWLQQQETQQSKKGIKRSRGASKVSMDTFVPDTSILNTIVDPYSNILIAKVKEMLSTLPPYPSRNLLPPLYISDKYIDEHATLKLDMVLALPLVRLRVTNQNWKDRHLLFQFFSGQVANPNDIVLTIKPKGNRFGNGRKVNNQGVLFLNANPTTVDNSTETGDSDNVNDIFNAVDNQVEHSINEIPSIFLKKLHTAGGLSIIKHEDFLSSLSQYIDNRESGIGYKTTGLEHVFTDIMEQIEDDLHSNLFEYFTKKQQLHAIHRNRCTPEELRQNPDLLNDVIIPGFDQAEVDGLEVFMLNYTKNVHKLNQKYDIKQFRLENGQIMEATDSDSDSSLLKKEQDENDEQHRINYANQVVRKTIIKNIDFSKILTPKTTSEIKEENFPIKPKTGDTNSMIQNNFAQFCDSDEMVVKKNSNNTFNNKRMKTQQEDNFALQVPVKLFAPQKSPTKPAKKESITTLLNDCSDGDNILTTRSLPLVVSPAVAVPVVAAKSRVSGSLAGKTAQTHPPSRIFQSSHAHLMDSSDDEDMAQRTARARGIMVQNKKADLSNIYNRSGCGHNPGQENVSYTKDEKNSLVNMIKTNALGKNTFGNTMKLAMSDEIIELSSD